MWDLLAGTAKSKETFTFRLFRLHAGQGNLCYVGVMQSLCLDRFDVALWKLRVALLKRSFSPCPMKISRAKSDEDFLACRRAFS